MLCAKQEVIVYCEVNVLLLGEMLLMIIVDLDVACLVNTLFLMQKGMGEILSL